MMRRILFKIVVVASLFILVATTNNVRGQMGGGGFGGVPQKTPTQTLLEEIANKPETWSKPTGEEPAWLKNGKSAVETTESLRNKLNESVTIEKSGDFGALQAILKEKVGLDISVNLQALEDDGVDIASLPGLPIGTGPVREQLRRWLEPRGLAYRVCEGYIEITSRNDAMEKPSTRFYDLSYVVLDNSRLAEILNAIFRSIDPDSWEENGGRCTCVPVGQVLVVRNTETNHLDIERLLARLSLNPLQKP